MSQLRVHRVFMNVTIRKVPLLIIKTLKVNNMPFNVLTKNSPAGVVANRFYLYPTQKMYTDSRVVVGLTIPLCIHR